MAGENLESAGEDLFRRRPEKITPVFPSSTGFAATEIAYARLDTPERVKCDPNCPGPILERRTLLGLELPMFLSKQVCPKTVKGVQ